MPRGEPSKGRTVAPSAEKKDTQRIVLKREAVLVVPTDASTDQIAAALKALGVGIGEIKKLKESAVEAWVVVGEYTGDTKEKAIEAYTGKAGEPDTKTGAFKAPTASAFAGGLVFKAPPKPLVEKEALA